MIHVKLIAACVVTEVLILTISLTTGCGGGGTAAPEDPLFGMRWDGERLPFVESVEIPESVTAGEPFTLLLYVSAAASQSSLAMVSDESCSKAPRLQIPSPWPQPVSYLIRPWTDTAAAADIEPGVVRVQIAILDPGERTICIESAPTRDAGGQQGWFYWYAWQDLEPSGYKDVAYHYYTISVLTPDGGS